MRLLLSCLLFIASCSPTKDTARNDKRVSAWMMSNPQSAAIKCYTLFPCDTDSTAINVLYTPGFVNIVDTNHALLDVERDIEPYINSIEDSLKSEIIKLLSEKKIKIPCPPSTHKIDTLKVKVYEKVKDKAQDQVLQKLKEDLAAAEQTKLILLYALMAFVVISLILVAIKRR